MRLSQILKPPSATVRAVARFAAGFALVALLAQLLFVGALAPRLPSTFELNFSGAASTSPLLATPGGLATAGWIIVVLGIASATAAIVLARGGQRGAYVLGALTCLVMPGFVGGFLGTAFVAIAGPDGIPTPVGALATGVILGIFMIVLYAPIVAAQPELLRRRQRSTVLDATADAPQPATAPASPPSD